MLGGRRADGEEIERASHQNAQVRTYEDAEGDAVRHRVAGMDLTFSAPKSLSVAWAMAATDAERWSLLQAHRDAVTDALHYVEREIGLAQGGKARSGPEEPGRLAWITIEHFTARPTIEITRPDPVTGVVGTEIRRPGRRPGAGRPAAAHPHDRAEPDGDRERPAGGGEPRRPGRPHP